MFFGDHNPPHLYARHGGQVARVALDGTVLDGEISRRAIRLVREWISRHKTELELCWIEPSIMSLPVALTRFPRSPPWSM
jgi:Domain of unknown function (DUF4160)